MDVIFIRLLKMSIYTSDGAISIPSPYGWLFSLIPREGTAQTILNYTLTLKSDIARNICIKHDVVL